MMARKCSHCGHNGHNSRTCATTHKDLVGGCGGGGGAAGGGGGVRLFGVQLYAASTPMKRSFSMDCLSFSFPNSSNSTSSPSSSPSTSSLISIDETSEKNSNGYLSDCLVARTQERKKGIPWTEEEHKLFLAGLEKLGKGDWRGISRNFVTTRTPTQVASHAQKYFLRKNSLNKKKRRSSLFDVSPNSDQKPREIESSKLKEHSFSKGMDDPLHDLTNSGVIHDTEAAQTCAGQMSNSSFCISSLLERSDPWHSPLDLKLGVSSPSPTELSNPSPNNTLFLGKIRVT